VRITERRIVHVATSINASESAPAWRSVSTATSVNTTDARPRGPNQPMNAMVSRRRPTPWSEMATGSIRTTVRLSRAYAIAVPSIPSVTTGPTKSTPNMIHTKNEAKRPTVSANSTGPCIDPRVAAPNRSPPTNAAMNPLPPIATAPA
jgi:hypothetical protein